MLSARTDGCSRRALEYASANDFCRIFGQDMDLLYWLALALTADAGKAEQCFVAGLDECIEGNAVFKDWARSWSKRVVIKSAIRLISPRPGAANSPTAIRDEEKPRSQAEMTLVGLTKLPPFDRFVFVMSVLEGYADRDCATLLGCSLTAVAAARLRALQQISRAIESLTLQRANRGSQDPVVLSDAEVA